MITVQTNVFCDICGCRTFGASGERRRMRAALAEAKKYGWVRAPSPYDGKLIDICPKCAREYRLTRDSA